MCLSLSFLSAHRLRVLTSAPDPALARGGSVLGGSARPFLHAGGAAAGGLSMSITLPKGLRGLDWLFFHVVLTKEPEWFQAVIFRWEHPSGQVLGMN